MLLCVVYEIHFYENLHNDLCLLNEENVKIYVKTFCVLYVACNGKLIFNLISVFADIDVNILSRKHFIDA